MKPARNPAYRDDYREFITTWQALEADYGAPPHRDFPRWKLDPRASRPAWDPSLSTGAACAADEEDKQLIECWMGAKWGFYQFPQDPARAAWELEAPIIWRPPPGFRFERPVASDTDIQLTFDLSLPLPAQLEAAKQLLISVQTGLRRHGQAVPRTTENQRGHWAALVETLDAGSGELLEQARLMASHGYRELLCLMPTTKKN